MDKIMGKSCRVTAGNQGLGGEEGLEVWIWAGRWEIWLHEDRSLGHAKQVIELSHDEIAELVRRALAEDVGTGDATSLAIVPESLMAKGRMRARQAMVVAGLSLVEEVFHQSGQTRVQMLVKDGARMEAGEELLCVEGPARSLLGGERVALNYVQRLSGIATLTARFVEAVRGTKAVILDTRKTTPGWRRLEKYAVRCGGGTNHRAGLFDMILIKDNHLAALDGQPDPIATAVAKARAAYPGLSVEVEADNLEQVEEAVGAGADVVMLDNMTPVEMAAAVKRVSRRAKTEASGGIDLSGVAVIAQTGVDYISVGALTHSAPSVDIGLDFD